MIKNVNFFIKMRLIMKKVGVHDVRLGTYHPGAQNLVT
jgi:hypothetical protein